MSLVMQCTPAISPAQRPFHDLLTTIAQVAIGKVESGYDSLAINDNTTGQSFHPPDIEHAQAYIADHVGNSIDAGLMQVNSQNWARLGLNSLTVFDPQINACAGLQVLREALSRYNTGRVSERGMSYAQRVITGDAAGPVQKPQQQPQGKQAGSDQQDGLGVARDDQFVVDQSGRDKPAP